MTLYTYLSHFAKIDETVLQVSGQAFHHARHLVQQDAKVWDCRGWGSLHGTPQLLEAAVGTAQLNQLLKL